MEGLAQIPPATALRPEQGTKLQVTIAVSETALKPWEPLLLRHSDKLNVSRSLSQFWIFSLQFYGFMYKIDTFHRTTSP